MRRLARCAAVAALAVLAACGDGGGGAGAPRGGTTQTSSPAGTVTGRPFDPTGSPGSRGGSPGPTATATPSPGGAPPAGARASAALDRACRRRGVDVQGLIVRNARAGSYVGYSTEYSDHSNEVSHPEYRGGYGYGKVDGNGGYRATWTVPATAPPGTATVRVITNANDPPIVLTYTVAAGAC